MNYLVSTKPDGEKRWWLAGEDIPADHACIRYATDAEAAIMDKIVRQDAAGTTPDTALGSQLTALMATTE